MYNGTKPPAAPHCWSRSFEERDKECDRCEYRLSCQETFLRSHGMPQPMQSPSYPQPPPMNYWSQHRTPSVQVPPPTHFPMAQYQQQPPPVAQPAPNQTTLPSSGNTAYFNQYYAPYSEESTAQRFGKHVVLRLLEVAFAELSKFFQLWRWPPSRGN